jgi:arginine N-succinyltransferase
VSPEYRKKPERLGLMISWVRFLFLRMHREWFRDELLAELLPPLEPDGTSHLWNALGRKFTAMTYAEADRLSKKNKEFVRGLFPEGPVYASLLPEDAQSVIGKVGGQTKGVEKMLRRIGFRYADRVDPFDGGPHFTARTDEVLLVRRSFRAAATAMGPEETATTKTHALVAVDVAGPPFFRCVLVPWRAPPRRRGSEAPDLDAKATAERTMAHLGSGALEQLGLAEGSDVWVLPVE